MSRVNDISKIMLAKLFLSSFVKIPNPPPFLNRKHLNMIDYCLTHITTESINIVIN